MVSKQGAFASPDNPITAPMGPGADLVAPLDQRARAAAAVAASLPLLIVIGPSPRLRTSSSATTTRPNLLTPAPGPRPSTPRAGRRSRRTLSS
jgi:hypothetical protein